MEAGSLAAAGHGPRTNINDAPPDARLIDQLQGELTTAEKAAAHHEQELERAKRVMRGCRAALDQLNAPEKIAPADVSF